MTVSARSLQRGGTLIGILIGIVIGLAAAVVTALVVTKTAVPFIGQAAKPAERGTAATGAVPAALPAVPATPKPQVPVAAGDVPDPNRGAGTRPRPAPGQPAVERSEIATVTAGTAPVQSAPSPPLPGTPAARPVPNPAPPASAPVPGGAPIRAATPSPPPGAQAPGTLSPAPGIAGGSQSLPAPQASVASATDRGASYLLQAGAFRRQDDADAMKLRLALMGMEAQIVTAEVGGTTLYRVRVGPYAGLDAMTRARSRLAENGVEATVLRLR